MVEIHTRFFVWDEINLCQCQKFGSPALNWLYRGHSVYWRSCCRIWCKMSAHALFLRGWNVLPQLQLSQTKSQDIFNCSLFSTKCARASGERWRLLLWQLAQNNSQCSGGPAPGFRQYFSISVNSPVCIPHFVNWQKQSTHITDVGYYTVGHLLPPHYRWSSSLFYSVVSVSTWFGFCCTKGKKLY